MLLSILHSCLIQYSTEDEVSISLEKNSTTTPLFECGALPRRHRAAAHIWKKTYILLFYLHGKVKVLYTTSLLEYYIEGVVRLGFIAAIYVPF